MSIWSRLFRRGRPADEPLPAPTEDGPAQDTGNTVALPTDPFVFECQSCGKVFEARRLRPLCPECDSSAVSLVSE